MQRNLNRASSYTPPVAHGPAVYARHYRGFVDRAAPYGIHQSKGNLVVFFPALGGMHGPVAVAMSVIDVHTQARNLLILNADKLDDPYAWAADIEIVWVGTGKPLTSGKVD